VPIGGHAWGILPQLSDFDCYVDTSFAGDIDTKRSTADYIFKICGGPVSWQSRMQPSVAPSSVESEYVAASAVAHEAMWPNQLLQQLEFMTSHSINYMWINLDVIRGLNTLIHGDTS
jgi:hypothetical protein